jgi:hypothetical protein
MICLRRFGHNRISLLRNQPDVVTADCYPHPSHQNAGHNLGYIVVAFSLSALFSPYFNISAWKAVPAAFPFFKDVTTAYWTKDTADWAKDKEVKSRCTTDKKLWFKRNLTEAEEAAAHRNTKTLYRL